MALHSWFFRNDTPWQRLYPEHKDNLNELYRYSSLGQASGAAEPFSSDDMQTEADVRILEIFPSADPDKIIRGRLLHYCLLIQDYKIEYSALSYVWGKEKAEYAIVIEGLAFGVTLNLLTALKAIRKKDESVYVWIDAICIDQNDEKEQAAQVSTMDNVYGIAKEVIVYFGSNTHNSMLVVPFLLFLRDKFVAIIDRHGGYLPTLAKSDLTRNGLPGVDDPRWRALRSFYAREWFERKWCFQEFCLAKRIFCWIDQNSYFEIGLLTEVYWHCIEAGLHNIAVGISGISLTISKSHPLYLLALMRQSIRHNYDEDANAVGPTFPEMLCMTSYGKVSKPHDAIYSLFGVYQVGQTLLGLPYPLVNYTRAIEEVMIDYACLEEWTTTPRHMSLLEEATMPRKLNLPSWVPDWSFPRPFIITDDLAADTGASFEQDRSNFVFNRSAQTLSVLAVEVDTIDCKDDMLCDVREYCYYKVLDVLVGMVSFLATSGRRVIAPKTCRGGDKMFAIVGERIPFVLRKQYTWYKLIGGCDASWIMEGQLFDASSHLYRGSPKRITLE